MRPPTDGPKMLVAELAGDLDVLTGHEADLRILADNLVEPSLTGPPEWQLPMFEHLRGDNTNADVLLVRDQSVEGRLVGAVPFVRKSFRWLLPIPMVDNWRNDLFFFGVPLLGDDKPQAALDMVLRGASSLLGAKAAIFRMLPQSGAFADNLRKLGREQGLGIAELDPFERAGLVCGQEFDTWFNENFTRKRRKEYRRLRSRLGEQGELEFMSRIPGSSLQDWIDDFVKLEGAGWKGERGTAIGCSDDLSKFLNESLSRFDASEKLLFWKLTLDGQTIATMFAIINGRKAWLVKIAYDENHARYSPGVLLILDVTRELLERGDLDVVDSSAIPDHPMINHLWRDRLAMTDIMIATPGTSTAMFGLMLTAERGRRRARAQAKTAYYLLLKRGSK